MFNVIFKKNRLIICLFFFFIFANKNALCFELENIDEQLKNADSVRSNNPKQFNKLINQLRNSRVSLSDEQTQYLNYLLAYQQSISGELESAVQKYKAIVNSTASNNLKFRANSSIINTFAITQNWSEGLFYLSKNLEMLKSLPNDETKQTGLIISAIFYNLIGQYELGLRYSSIAQSETKSPRTLCTANQLVLEAKFKLGQVNADNKEISQAVESCEKANEIIMTSQIQTYLAKLHMDNGDSQKAKNVLLNTLEAIKNSNYAPVIALYYVLLAEIYFEEKNYNKSAIYANKTVIKTGGSGNIKPLISAYSLLYKIHLQNESHQEALDYYVKFSEANKAHLEGEKAKHLAFQLAQHKSFEQKSKIKLLNEKNALLTSEQALAKVKVANVQLIIAILTVTLALLTLWGGRLYKTHKRIKELAEFDALTGIYNRGHFTHVANSAIKYCKNAQQELSIIMFDLDHFKSVNDNYGHACGDWALKETINVCQNIGRQNDIFARLGGEEFCLLLPSCDIHAATLRAEACRVAIEEIITEASGFDFSLSASFGVTNMKMSGFELDKLLADADSAAYASKHAGRNRVTVFTVKESEKAEQLDNSWDITD